MLDVTWEAPDGTITPLDGYLDPYFQEVYLEAESVPIFSKLVKHVSTDALWTTMWISWRTRCASTLTRIRINYGKAAKRMYNIFRLTGRYEEAAFLRELFDEPATLLYQVHSLIRTIDDAMMPGSSISMATIVSHTDQLILPGRRCTGGRAGDRDRASSAASSHRPESARRSGRAELRGRGRAGRGHQHREQLLLREAHRDADHQGLHHNFCR